MVLGWSGSVASLGPIQAQAIGASKGAAFTTERIRCPVTLDPAAGEVESGTYHCGGDYVPESYAKPQDRVIDLAYLVLKSRAAPEPDLVVYLSGGPGASALTEFSREGMNIRNGFTKVRECRDILTFDQQGNSNSSMLFCSTFAQLLPQVLTPTVRWV
jgi:hypothetical protein